MHTEKLTLVVYGMAAKQHHRADWIQLSTYDGLIEGPGSITYSIQSFFYSSLFCQSHLAQLKDKILHKYSNSVFLSSS